VENLEKHTVFSSSKSRCSENVIKLIYSTFTFRLFWVFFNSSLHSFYVLNDRFSLLIDFRKNYIEKHKLVLKRR
jgi:hypothetical protein